jgi:hypothetical protein
MAEGYFEMTKFENFPFVTKIWRKKSVDPKKKSGRNSLSVVKTTNFCPTT